MLASSDIARSTQGTVVPDGLLVERIAALGDRAALAELDARHGLRLYALAYALTFDPAVADGAVNAVFREVWRSAASFSASDHTVHRWLAALARRAVHDVCRHVPEKHARWVVASPAYRAWRPIPPATVKRCGRIRSFVRRAWVMTLRLFVWGAHRQQPATS